MMSKRPAKWVSKVGSTEEAVSSHSLEDAHEATYDEVLLALGKLGKIMRFYGLFPINDVKMTEGPRFQNAGCGSVFTAVTLCGILGALYLMIKDYGLLIPNVLERIIIIIFLGLLCIFAGVNLLSMVARSDQWPAFFRRFQSIDVWLGIRVDQELRSYAVRVAIIFTIISANSLGSVIMTIAMKYLNTESDFSGSGFAIGLFLYSWFVYGCHLLPEMLLTYLCRALAIRLQRLSMALQKIVDKLATPSVGEISADIADQLEKYRMTFQFIMDAVQHTNIIMGPVLLVTSVLNTFVLSVCVYTMSRQSIDNVGATFMQTMSVVIALTRLIPVCLYTNAIKVEVNKMKRILYTTPTLSTSTESVEEFRLFVECAISSKPDFTACDFLQVDKIFLKDVAQVILTYALTLIQFGEELEASTVNKCS